MMYLVGRRLSKYVKINPILIAMIFLIILLSAFGIDYSTYKGETDWISWLLGPVVVMLAIPLYKNQKAIMENLAPICVGIGTSIGVAVLSIWSMIKVFGLSDVMFLSLLPKSITTPMAIEVTKLNGGNTGLTIIFVILTGVIGASLADFTLKLFRIESPLAKGIGIGASSHGIGTSKAVELGEEEAASSSLAMGLTGVVTVLIFSIVYSVLS